MTASEKKTLTILYCAAALICIALVILFVYIGNASDAAQAEVEKNRRSTVQAGADARTQAVRDQLITGLKMSEPEIINTIKNDYKAFNQDGEEVGLMDLKGKVWVFAQFYSSCPECLTTNLGVLKALNDKYKDNPNFHIVTVSVDKDFDDFKRLKEMEKNLKTSSDKWWLLKCSDDKKLNDYVNSELDYVRSQESTEGDNFTGKIAHDMGISVFDAELNMWVKVDLFGPTLRKDEAGVLLAKGKLYKTIENQLKKLDK